MMKLKLFIALVMTEISGTLGSIDLENWMRDLPGNIRDVPVIYLAIPGSHDSMSYGITRASGLAPDAEPVLDRLYPLFRGTILRWTITQSANTIQQLQMGIRYFDLRLATKTGTQDLYFTHGLYADEITLPLRDILEFVTTHPKEIVMLDFQHFYNFATEDHKRLMSMLLNMFGAKLCPRRVNLLPVTLNAMERLGQQVIVIYRHQAVYSTSEFWQPQAMPSPWPRREKPNDLLYFFENLRRPTGMGFVHQAVLTPTPAFILLRWLSSLRSKCAIPVQKVVLPKLVDYSPGPPSGTGFDASKATINVIIADFVDLDDAIFSRTIISLNLKLLKNTDIVYHNVHNGYDVYG